jgi:hypothetical protein
MTRRMLLIALSVAPLLAAPHLSLSNSKVACDGLDF